MFSTYTLGYKVVFNSQAISLSFSSLLVGSTNVELLVEFVNYNGFPDALKP